VEDPLKRAHVVPEPPYSPEAPAIVSFGRRFERLFPGQACYFCGDPSNSVDHLVPYSRDGVDTPENLVPCCFRCNQMKSNLTIGEFVLRMEKILETLAKKSEVRIGARKQIQAGEVLQDLIAA
jgi:hypothetical protein